MAACVLTLAACGDDGEAPAPTPPAVTQGFDGFHVCELRRGPGTTPVLSTQAVRVVLDRPITAPVTEPDRPRTAALMHGHMGSSLHTADELTVELTVVDGAQGGAIEFVTAASRSELTYREAGHWSVTTGTDGRPTLQGDSDATLSAQGGMADAGWTATCHWDLRPARAPAGPLSYDEIGARFEPSTTSSKARGVVEQALDSGCGELKGYASVGLLAGDPAANYMADYVIKKAALHPIVMPFIGIARAIGTSSDQASVALYYFSMVAGDACVASELSAVSAEIATQAQRIDGIVAAMGLLENAFYNQVYAQAVTDSTQDAYVWRRHLDTISPVSADAGGIFGNFMNNLGLWTGVFGPADTSADLRALAVSSSFKTAASQLNPADFQTALRGATGTKLPTVCASDCFNLVTQDATSSLIKMSASTFTALKAKMNQAVPFANNQQNTWTTENVVPYYEAYNNTIATYFHRAGQTLQQAYTLEFTINQANFFRAANEVRDLDGSVAQMLNVGGITETHYDFNALAKALGTSPTLEDQAKAYNHAQKQLAKLYAARFNQLLLNTYNFIVSDVPTGTQRYPTSDLVWTSPVDGTTRTHPAPAYLTEVGKSLTSSAGAQGATPLSLVQGNADGKWKDGAVLYQYAGLRDAVTCATTILNYDKTNAATGTLADALAQPGACPAIFAAADGTALDKGYYDGDTLQPYSSYDPVTHTTQGPMVLTGRMTNNLKFCEPTSPNLGWYAPTGTRVGNAAGLVAGAVYLNCGNWYTPDKTLDSNGACRAFPRAHCPANSVAPPYNRFYQDEYAPAARTITRTQNEVGCSGRYPFPDGSRYVAITNLFDRTDYPQAGRTFDAIISKPDALNLSPWFDNGRQADDGVSKYIGWIGSYALVTGGNNIYNNADHKAEARFGLRLWNQTNAGYYASSPLRGYVLGLRLEAVCYEDSGAYYAKHLMQVLTGGDMEKDGYSCVGGATIRCTILDGSQFDLGLEEDGGGSGTAANYLTIRAVAP